jgi:outer membrane protein assembly factor BamD (BamD/ComL family)
MKKLQNLFLLVICFLLFAGCGPSKEKMNSKIQELEKQLYSANVGPVDTSKANEMIDLYLDFEKKFPKDTAAAEYLNRAASLAMNTGKAPRSIEIINDIIAKYPDYKKIASCYFLKGFVYDYHLKDINNARKAYQEFIAKFPKDELADDAQISMNNLGKSDEQIIKEFEEKLKQDSLVNQKK